MPNNQEHDTRTTDPLARVTVPVMVGVNARAINVGDGPMLIADTDWQNHPDWQIQSRNERYTSPGDNSSGGADNVPPWASYYYCSEFFHPNGYFGTGNGATPGSRPVALLTNEFGSNDDPNGKAFVMFEESHDEEPGMWGTDADFLIETPEKHREMFIDCYMKVNPGFLFRCIRDQDLYNSQDAVKIFRGRDYIGGDTGVRFGFGLDVDISFVVQLKASAASGANEAKIAYNIKRYPNETNESGSDNDIDPGSGQVPWAQTVGDGNWHRVRVRAKIEDTFGDGTGKFQVAWDDQMVLDLNIAWLTQEPPGGANIGWNQYGWGGNMHNPYGLKPSEVTDYATEGVEQTQWIAFSKYRVFDGVLEDSKTLFGV